MTRALSHEEAFALLDVVALDTLDALDASERAAALVHIDECEICRAELASLRETLSDLALSAPTVDAATCRREPIRDRLMARVAADVAGATDPKPSDPPKATS